MDIILLKNVEFAACKEHFVWGEFAIGWLSIVLVMQTEPGVTDLVFPSWAGDPVLDWTEKQLYTCLSSQFPLSVCPDLLLIHLLNLIRFYTFYFNVNALFIFCWSLRREFRSFWNLKNIDVTDVSLNFVCS